MLTPPDSKTSLKDDVYAAFCLYCELNGRKPCASQEFWTRLGKVFGPALSANRQSMVDGQKKRWTNIDISAREGTGHLLDVDSEPRAKAMPDFSGAGTIPGATLLEEIYGVHVEKGAKPDPKKSVEAPIDASRIGPVAAPSAPSVSPDKVPATARRTEAPAARATAVSMPASAPTKPSKTPERFPVPTPDKVLPMSPRSRAYHAAIPARPDHLLMDVLDEMIYGKPAQKEDRSAELEDLFAFSDEERSLVESIRKSKEAA